MQWQRKSIKIRPLNIHPTPLLLRHTERLPNSFGRIHNVITARRLVVMLLIAPRGRVTLVHHHCHHTLPIAIDGYVQHAPFHLVEPPRGQRHHRHIVGVVLAITLRRAAAVTALLEAVKGQYGLGAGGHRRRAVVYVVELPYFAAFGVVPFVALALGGLLPLELPTWLALFVFCKPCVICLGQGYEDEQDQNGCEEIGSLHDWYVCNAQFVQDGGKELSKDYICVCIYICIYIKRCLYIINGYNFFMIVCLVWPNENPRIGMLRLVSCVIIMGMIEGHLILSCGL